MNENTIETGGCLCGNIRYEFKRKDVVSAGHCHCKDCQRITGSGKATIVFIVEPGGYKPEIDLLFKGFLVLPISSCQ